MTETKPQSEPTMEEILASIRRIISENDEEQEAKKRVESTPAPVVTLVQPATVSGEAAAPVAPADEPAEQTAAPVTAAAQPRSRTAPGAGAVLELTEMIAEDGTVISLFAAEVRQEAAPSPAQPAEASPVQQAESSATQPAAPEPTPVAEASVADVVAREPEPIVPEPIVPEPIVEDKIAPSPETAQKVEKTMDNPKDTAAGHGETTNDGLVSAATSAAATATFAQLARSMAQEPQSTGNIGIGGGTTLEDMVREMLRPMLKTWLDQNLPKMVEHMVRRELDRMVRRAEDV